MLSLRIDDSQPQLEPRLLVSEWRDDRGRPCARGLRSGEQGWLEVRGVGVYLFHAVEGEVSVKPEPEATPEILRDTFERSVLPLALQFQGLEVLHASAILGPPGLVVICGNSGSGKSTLAGAMAARGGSLWADDAVAFAIKYGRPEALPLPFSPRLKTDGARFPAALARWFEAAQKAGKQGEVSAARRENSPLAALLVLNPRARKGGREPTVKRLGLADALVTCLRHGYCFDQADEARRTRMVESYLALSGTTPVLEVGFDRDLGRLVKLAERVEASLEGNGLSGPRSETTAFGASSGAPVPAREP